MIGIDVVGIERFREVLKRSPWLERGLFTEQERIYCRSQADPVRHLASTFAAKEAVVKAIGDAQGPTTIRQVEISRAPSGRPSASVSGRPDHDLAISLTHDGGFAFAI